MGAITKTKKLRMASILILTIALLMFGCYVGYRWFLGQALVLAVQSRYDVSIIERLLQDGADANAVQVRRWIDSGTPVLTYAVSNGDVEVIKLLLKYHANPNKPGTHFFTPLQSCPNEEIRKLLLLNTENSNTNKIPEGGSR